jgi:hypothetical protein
MPRGVLGVLAVSVLVAGLSGCTADGVSDGVLPPGRSASAVSTTPAPAVRTPAPVDDEVAVVDAGAGRTASPAQGTVTLTVSGAAPGPAGAAYLGWLRASLTAFARPGEDDGGVERYAAPLVVRDVRERVRQLVVRGWAEYGAARVSGVAVRVTGATAAVTACLDLSGLATRDAAGRLAGRDGPVRSTATLTSSGGGWRVTADRRTAVGDCP